jgi:hypothetical protein
VVEELPDEGGSGGHIADDLIAVVRAELRIGHQPDGTLLQRVAGVHDAAGPPDLVHGVANRCRPGVSEGG